MKAAGSAVFRSLSTSQDNQTPRDVTCTVRGYCRCMLAAHEIMKQCHDMALILTSWHTKPVSHTVHVILR